MVLVGTTMVMALVSGCRREPSTLARFYADIRVPTELTADLLPRRFEAGEVWHEALPFPRPRSVVARLPGDVRWRVWVFPGEGTLVLGVRSNVVIFKEVIWDSGDTTADAATLPEFE